MQDQIEMQTLSPYASQTATSAMGSALTLRGIRDAVEKIREPEESAIDGFKVNKWMNEAYERILAPMATGFSGYKETNNEWSEWGRKVKPSDFKAEYGMKVIGMEPNYPSVLRTKEEEMPTTHEWKRFGDGVNSLLKEGESPTEQGRTVFAKNNGWYIYDGTDTPQKFDTKEDNSKAHDLFWQSYRRTGKLPFTATHHG